MPRKRSPTIEAARKRINTVLWLDHVELLDEDIEWLATTERLTLWCVKVPKGLLARLEKLWWLDIRGGSANDLEVARGATNLQYLAVNQIRGVRDLSVLSEMVRLRYINLYGLPRVALLPPLNRLTDLEHAQLGQMSGLLSLHELLQAPRLRELVLIKKVNVTDKGVDEIMEHTALKHFSWFAEDVPVNVWVPVVERIGLPPASLMHPEEWFGVSR